MQQKILFFVPTLSGGGAERTVIQLANGFADQGLEIHLGVCNIIKENAKLLPEVNTNVQLVDLKCGRVSSAIIPLKKLMQAEQYNWIISTLDYCNIVVTFAKKLARVNTQLIFREVSTPSKNINMRGFSKYIFKFLININYKAAHSIACVSKGVENDFRKYYNYKINNLITIYDPVLEDTYFSKLKEPIKHHFFNDDNKVILAIGRLTEAKNFSFLIRSFKLLHNQHPETRLIILGEGELRSELEILIQNLGLSRAVDLPGFDSNPYAYFKYVSLFVLSSSWEGLPGVLIQALASKVKVVSTNCPSGPMEILHNSKFGLLVECNDQISMTAAMQQSIFGNYVEYSNSDFETHIQQFYIKNVLQQYLVLMGIYLH